MNESTQQAADTDKANVRDTAAKAEIINGKQAASSRASSKCIYVFVCICVSVECWRSKRQSAAFELAKRLEMQKSN